MAGSPSFIARLSSAASGITSLYGDQRPAATPAHAFQHGAGVRALHCYGKRDDSLPFHLAGTRAQTGGGHGHFLFHGNDAGTDIRGAYRDRDSGRVTLQALAGAPGWRLWEIKAGWGTFPACFLSPQTAPQNR
jgi:hypothetical protein